VRHHPSGAPEAWGDGRPLPVGISPSDRAGWAVCLLGLLPGDVGCDLELVVPPAELATYCLHALTAASSMPDQTALDRLLAITTGALRQPA